MLDMKLVEHNLPLKGKVASVSLTDEVKVLSEIIIQSISRCHPKLKRHMIEDKLTISEMDNIASFLTELVEKSISTKKEGKQIEE